MPLLLDFEDGDARIGVWHMSESIAELRSMLVATADYDAQIQHFRSDRRKREFLAVRVLLRTLLKGFEPVIAHLPSGKPYLTDSSWHISLSHTAGYCAVMLHPSTDVGVDIEYHADRILNITSRFLCHDEQIVLSTCEKNELLDKLLIHWSAKESAYKLIGNEVVDFRENMSVAPFCLDASSIYMRTSSVRFPYLNLGFLKYPEFVLTWTR